MSIGAKMCACNHGIIVHTRSRHVPLAHCVDMQGGAGRERGPAAHTHTTRTSGTVALTRIVGAIAHKNTMPTPPASSSAASARQMTYALLFSSPSTQKQAIVLSWRGATACSAPRHGPQQKRRRRSRCGASASAAAASSSPPSCRIVAPRKEEAQLLQATAAGAAIVLLLAAAVRCGAPPLRVCAPLQCVCVRSRRREVRLFKQLLFLQC